jgi:hypothetical protein
MILHQYKDINFGFVIIAPRHDYGNICCTIRTIKNRYSNSPYICIVGNDTPKPNFDELNEVCPTFKGKDTITSLINTGMKKGCKEWNLFVMEGTIVRPNLDRKYSLFIESEKDVLFPIVTEYEKSGKVKKVRSNFEEATLNGMFIHAKTFKEVGNFEDSSIPTSKFIWGVRAQELGCKFKGILGAQLL